MSFTRLKAPPFVFVCILSCWSLSCGRPAIPPQPTSISKPVASTLPSPAAKPLARGEVIFGAYGGNPWHLNVELARTWEQRRIGLMNRKALGDDEGMLFIFDERRQHEFYMKNTYIPLDIIFLSGTAGEVEVVGILKNMRPFDETPRSAGAPSISALEVRSPLASEHAVKVGDRVILNVRE